MQDLMAFTNGVENFWSHLKRGVDGISHLVSEEHLQKYVNEYSLRYNTRKQSTNDKFILILNNITTRVKYQDFINHGK
ncbi:MAG: transposase [Saprospiraceae bacterium]|nr:transposase [Candidatus Defluviibacterium haderslevense]